MVVSDFDTVTAGNNYLATVNITKNGTLTDPEYAPTVTIYDSSRNMVVSGVSMTHSSVGIYTYSYTTSSSASAGNWETVFSVNANSNKYLSGNDYWSVVSSPAQVIINSVSDTSIPEVSANITITNEGLTGYEYQYEWCVVSNVNNDCGGGDDIFYAVAAKYINPGEDFNTTLTATVPSVGNYYFKVKAYFSTDSSTASRSFVATNDSNSGNGSGGGGGGSSSSSSGSSSNNKKAVSLINSDFNNDNVTNSIDFSILLAFWKTSPPFKNSKVDINKDGKVDSVDFSIMLYRWNKK